MANIDLEMGGKTVNLSVAPIYAAIIYQFQVREEWQADQLAKTLKISVSALRRRMAYWQSQGFVKEKAPDLYCLADDSGDNDDDDDQDGDKAVDPLGGDDDDHDGVVKPSKDRMEEDMKIYWSYVSNMLLNLESASLESIFRMLQMFITAGSASGAAAVSEYGIDAIRGFLDRKVREQELLFVGGCYKLPNKN